MRHRRLGVSLVQPTLLWREGGTQLLVCIYVLPHRHDEFRCFVPGTISRLELSLAEQSEQGFMLKLRIPAKADTDSDNCRTPIPIELGQWSERSDGLGLAIKNCPK